MPAFNLPHITLPHIAIPHFVVLGNVLATIFTIIAIFFLFLISYSAVRVFEIRKKEERFVEHELAEYAHHHSEAVKEKAEGGRSKNGRWNQVLDHIYSISPADWKIAIIESDSMLDELLHQMGFRGDSLGERLKEATRETFPPLTIAWEAHAIRNRIAHEGSTFEVTSHEAKRVVALYEDIFRNFGYI